MVRSMEVICKYILLLDRKGRRHGGANEGSEVAGSRSGASAIGNKGSFGPPHRRIFGLPANSQGVYIPLRLPRSRCGEPPIGTACVGFQSLRTVCLPASRHAR